MSFSFSAYFSDLTARLQRLVGGQAPEPPPNEWTIVLQKVEKIIADAAHQLKATPSKPGRTVAALSAIEAALKAVHAEQADDNSLRFLQIQPKPAGFPSYLYTEFLVPNLDIVVSLAKEYQINAEKNGVSWEVLLQAGLKGAASHLLHHAKQPRTAGTHFEYAIRQQLVNISMPNGDLGPGEAGYLTSRSPFWPKL